MKQAILMNFKPKEVQKILNDEKTLTISKTMPKCKLPIDVYIYCSRGKGTKKAPSNYQYVWVEENADRKD